MEKKNVYANREILAPQIKNITLNFGFNDNKSKIPPSNHIGRKSQEKVKEVKEVKVKRINATMESISINDQVIKAEKSPTTVTDEFIKSSNLFYSEGELDYNSLGLKLPNELNSEKLAAEMILVQKRQQPLNVEERMKILESAMSLNSPECIANIVESHRVLQEERKQSTYNCVSSGNPLDDLVDNESTFFDHDGSVRESYCVKVSEEVDRCRQRLFRKCMMASTELEAKETELEVNKSKGNIDCNVWSSVSDINLGLKSVECIKSSDVLEVSSLSIVRYFDELFDDTNGENLTSKYNNDSLVSRTVEKEKDMSEVHLSTPVRSPFVNSRSSLEKLQERIETCPSVLPTIPRRCLVSPVKTNRKLYYDENVDACNISKGNDRFSVDFEQSTLRSTGNNMNGINKILDFSPRVSAVPPMRHIEPLPVYAKDDEVSLQSNHSNSSRSLGERTNSTSSSVTTSYLLYSPDKSNQLNSNNNSAYDSLNFNRASCGSAGAFRRKTCVVLPALPKRPSTSDAPGMLNEYVKGFKCLSEPRRPRASSEGLMETKVSCSSGVSSLTNSTCFFGMDTLYSDCTRKLDTFEFPLVEEPERSESHTPYELEKRVELSECELRRSLSKSSVEAMRQAALAGERAGVALLGNIKKTQRK